MKKNVIIMMLFVSMFLVGCSSLSDSVKMTKYVPPDATVGEYTSITIQLTNEDSKTQFLNSIYIDEEFLEGFQVVSVYPTPRSEDEALGIHYYEFNQEIPKDESGLVILFSLKSLKAGDYKGNIDICINDDVSCFYGDVRIIASEATS